MTMKWKFVESISYKISLLTTKVSALTLTLHNHTTSPKTKTLWNGMDS